jgi:hypothetical protein
MRTFTPIWNKYRVAILRKMIDSSETAQEYRLSAHEFKAMNPKHKGGYAFILQVSKGKSINNIKDSIVAQDLLEILQLSKKASELIDESPYQLTLDKQFVLHISRIQQTENK